ncbi:MAG: hypothetical protein U0359_15090 [Byssovorax sp.]
MSVPALPDPALPSPSDLDAAGPRLERLTLLFRLLVATGALSIFSHLVALTHLPIPGIFGGSMLPLIDLVLRCAFVHEAVLLSKPIGKTPVELGRASIILAFVIPIYNLFRPFGIIRALTAASATDDLPALRKLEARAGGYRQAALTERLIPPPAPPAPMVLAWQLTCGVGFFGIFIQPWVWLALTLSATALQILVLARLLQRFRARYGHLRALADAATEA